jgi:hypothetical protein
MDLSDLEIAAPQRTHAYAAYGKFMSPLFDLDGGGVRSSLDSAHGTGSGRSTTMPIVIVLTLVPTLSFYFYVLVQFVIEANRRRHHDTCTLIVPLHSVRSAEAGYDGLDENNQPGGDDMVGADPALHPTAQQRPSENPSSGQVLSTFLRNRLSVISSQTGRLPAKHAAKG